MAQAFEHFQNDAVAIDTYIDSMENNRSQFVQNADQTIIQEEHAAFFADQELKFLVITEDWCIDSVQFIPVLVKLAGENPGIELRVLRRDEHTDLAEQYPRKDGYNAIPVIIIFDGDGNELGSIVERPEQASAEMAEETRKFQEANPDLDGIKRNIDKMPEDTKEAVKTHSRKWRMTQQDRFTDLLLIELREIVDSARKATTA
jgi:hypothetical protein